MYTNKLLYMKKYCLFTVKKISKSVSVTSGTSLISMGTILSFRCHFWHVLFNSVFCEWVNSAYVAFYKSRAILRQEEVRSWDYALLLSNDFECHLSYILLWTALSVHKQVIGLKVMNTTGCMSLKLYSCVNYFSWTSQWKRIHWCIQSRWQTSDPAEIWALNLEPKSDICL